MGTFRHQAEVALAKYIERGHQALALLEQGDMDGALLLLDKRKAAFHNFRVAEALAASQENAPIQDDPGILARWEEIASLNAKLADMMSAEAETLKAEWVDTRERRQRIARFRSGNSDVNPLRHMV